jgi:hypothetical protein
LVVLILEENLRELMEKKLRELMEKKLRLEREHPGLH